MKRQRSSKNTSKMQHVEGAGMYCTSFYGNDFSLVYFGWEQPNVIHLIWDELTQLTLRVVQPSTVQIISK